MKILFWPLFLSSFLPLVCSAAPTPPAAIARATYPGWLAAIGAPASPYFDYVFGWYEAQSALPLPAQVAANPDKLIVSVDKPLAEAIRVEGSGAVEEGTTYGLETYALIDAPLAEVLETILFRWGKPVGEPSGITHPNDTVFGFREEKLTQEWGPTSYKTFSTDTHGGLAHDLDDSYSLLLRGNAATGYTLVGSFIAPNGNTATTSFLTILMIKSTPDGKTEYRAAGMLTGQNYAFFGVNSGRSNYGFNASRIRAGQLDFLSQVKSLRDHGKIPERQ